MFKSLLISSTFAVFLQACQPASEGSAPAELTPPAAEIPSLNDFHIVQKNATTVTTSNAWMIDADHSNIIKNKTLSNGWQIEALYE